MKEFINRWNFVRSETLEILSSLSDEDLLFKPDGEKWQPLFYQFGCIARTQLVYAEATKTGVMDFSLFGSSNFPSKDDAKTKDSIKQLLDSSNTSWLNALTDNHSNVQWPGEKKSIELHMQCLAEHERLHHGQLISYFTLASIELPPKFKSNWAL